MESIISTEDFQLEVDGQLVCREKPRTSTSPGSARNGNDDSILHCVSMQQQPTSCLNESNMNTVETAIAESESTPESQLLRGRLSVTTTFKVPELLSFTPTQIIETAGDAILDSIVTQMDNQVSEQSD